MEKSADKNTQETKVDIVIFGAGIAGLWTFHRLKKMGYSALLLERDSIGCGQTIASQGIIHSGLKFTLAGKVNSLALSISKMPDIWRAALRGEGDIDLSAATINAQSQHLLIPAGFMGGLTKLVTERALGNNVHSIDKKNWPKDLQDAGFKGSLIHMDEKVLDIPSVLRALANPYKNAIKKINMEEAAAPFEFLQKHNIKAKQIIFTTAASNHIIALDNKDDKGLETQKRPLVQGIFKNAPFPLWAHLVGKTDKPVASITTHKTSTGEYIWYIGGGAAERAKTADPNEVYNACIKAFKTYLPNLDTSKMEWCTLPIDRIEGKSKTQSWMPDTPTIHHGDKALYCWPTKLTFAPLLSDMIVKTLNEKNITPSNTNADFTFLENATFAKTPWDTAQWRK